MEKIIESAIKDVLRERVAIANDGMLATYCASFASRKILALNGVRVHEDSITINGEKVARIIDCYSSRKVRGCYRMLMPKIEEVR